MTPSEVVSYIFLLMIPFFWGGKLDDQTIYQNHHERNQSVEKSLMNTFKYSIITSQGAGNAQNRQEADWPGAEGAVRHDEVQPTQQPQPVGHEEHVQWRLRGRVWSVQKRPFSKVKGKNIVRFVGFILILCREQQSKYQAWLVMIANWLVVLIPLWFGNGWSNVL